MIYDWGIFWENGERAGLPMPFGPEHPDNVISDPSSEWLTRANEVYPNFTEMLNEFQVDYIIVVNPSREATEDEEKYFKNNGMV